MNHEYLVEMGERLKAVRIVLRMSREDVAEKLGVEAETVTKWEDGTKEMPVSALAHFCKLFRVSSAFLLGTDAKPEGNCAHGYETVFLPELKSYSDEGTHEQ